MKGETVRKIYIIFLISVSLVLLSGCKPDYELEMKTIKLNDRFDIADYIVMDDIHDYEISIDNESDIGLGEKELLVRFIKKSSGKEKVEKINVNFVDRDAPVINFGDQRKVLSLGLIMELSNDGTKKSRLRIKIRVNDEKGSDLIIQSIIISDGFSEVDRTELDSFVSENSIVGIFEKTISLKDESGNIRELKITKEVFLPEFFELFDETYFKNKVESFKSENQIDDNISIVTDVRRFNILDSRFPCSRFAFTTINEMIVDESSIGNCESSQLIFDFDSDITYEAKLITNNFDSLIESSEYYLYDEVG